MRAVKSSNIAAYEWTPYGDEPPFDEGGELRIQFNSGRTYTYADVPAEVADRIDGIVDSGESIGSYFAKNIRPFFPGIEVD